MVQGLVVEAEMVVITALVGWVVVMKPELKMLVGGEAVTLGKMEVMGLDLEVGRGSVMVTLLQDLQHMRW